ncbi:MAG: hypothetical protein V3U90_03735, partial [Dehalococcoidia bacterium]
MATVAIGLVIALVAASCVRKEEEEAAPAPTSTTAAPEVIATLPIPTPTPTRTYVSETLGFRINYPFDWIVDEEKVTDGVGFVREGEATLTVQLLEVVPGTPLENVLDQEVFDLQSGALSFQESSRRSTTVNGQSAHESLFSVTFEGEEGDIDFKGRMLMVGGGDTVHMLLGLVLLEHVDNWWNPLVQSMDSFEVIPIPPPTSTPTTISPTPTSVSPTPTSTPFPSLRVDKVILFPFTVDNIENPDLTGLAISSAPPGTPVALVGSGFSSNPAQNVVAFNGLELGVWMADSNFVATFLAGPIAPISGDLTAVTPGGARTFSFDLEEPEEVTSPVGEVMQNFLDVLEDRFLTGDIGELVALELPELEDEMNQLADLKVEFEQTLNQISSRELAFVESMIQATGFVRFFEENPSLVYGEGLTGARGLLSPLLSIEPIVITATIGAALIGAAVAFIVAGLLIWAGDASPAVTITLNNDISEAGTNSVTCTGDDTGFGESGLESVTFFLNSGDGSLSPPSGTPIAARTDPFSTTATFTPDKTGRSRNANISCKASDDKNNAFIDLDFS